MPLFNMQPKDKKSPRKAEVRPANVVIFVLPLLLCFILSVIIWCYTVGSGKPAEDATDTFPVSESSPAEDTTDGLPAGSAPVESLPAESEAQPSDV